MPLTCVRGSVTATVRVFTSMRTSAILAGLAITGSFVFADVFMSGKVTMVDGSPPPSPVVIWRYCPGFSPVNEATTNKHGTYLWRMLNNVEYKCELRAVLAGYESNTIETWLDRLFFSTQLPTLVLRRKISQAEPEDDSSAKLPRGAAKSWDQGMKALTAQKWPEAERLFRATLQEVPKFAPAWNALGAACQYLHKVDDARDAYQHAIDVDPKLLIAYLHLTRLELAAQHWPEAIKAADALIKADPTHRYLEAYLDDVIARYATKDLDGAEATLNQALPLDMRHEVPRLEYFMGAVLNEKGDKAGAAEHLKKYLELAPKADDVAVVTGHLDELKSASSSALPLPGMAEMLAPAIDPNLPVVGNAWVPGGMKALAAMARLKGVPSYENFFLEYCRSISIETSKANNMRTPGYSANLRAYMAAVAELTALGEQRRDKTVIALSLADPTRLQKAKQILPLLGWKVVEEDGAARLEPGDQGADGPRQQIPAAFGVDEVAMAQALQAGKSFTIEIPTENASLTGGVAWWGSLVQGFSSLPGGLAEVFERDPRLAETYAALAAMPADAAKALVTRVGLRVLAAQYPDVLWLYSDKFSLSSGTVVVPGGVEAEKIWAKLAGANPRDPPAFLQALLASDRGRVAAFYSALAHADAAHQRFFTKSLTRAQRFYNWYRDSDELREGINRPARIWRPAFFQKVPLDDNGNIRFPGGKAAWTTSSAADEEALLHLNSLEALVAIAQLEEKRRAHFDDVSARLLARHFNEWHALFPYFEELPGLGRAEFEALEAFSKGVAEYRKPAQNLVMGEWHSLVALIVLGRKAGSLDDATGVRAFRHACEGLLANDYSAKAMAVLHEIAGPGANLDDAVAGGLLRLGGPQRAAFERVRVLQGAPRLQALGGSPDPGTTLAALAGLVYGAVVNPESLLISEDPTLMKKHQYVPDSCGTCSSTSLERLNLFSAASLLPSTTPPGSHVIGGFMHFDGVARNLVHGGKVVDVAFSPASRAENSAAAPAPIEEIAPAEATFRVNGRLVQTFTTVTDSRGHYVDDLKGDQFTILEDGKPVRIVAFENETSDISCTLLLDTTQSMQASLPALKNAALKLIEGLRPNDSVAVYALSGGITELQPFTTDKDAAARAILKTEPGGMTALYDGLVRVTRDIAGRPGKKVIVVFTDGDDNISMLSGEAATLRAKTAGVPIYTIAKGAELHEETLQQLAAISRATGGMSFTLRWSFEIVNVFDKVLQDVLHGYLLAFQPSSAEGHTWHTIKVQLKAPRGRNVRAREGYYPE